MRRPADPQTTQPEPAPESITVPITTPATTTTPSAGLSTFLPSLRIDADVLIAGRGDPVQKQTVITSGTSIVHIGDTSTLPAHYTTNPTYTQLHAPVLMPGLWDAHVHFTGASAYNVHSMTATPPALAGARIARDLAALLNAGFTSVREVAGYGAEIAPAVRDGWLPGPNIYSSVAMISATAGHGDDREVSLCEIHKSMDAGPGGSPVPFYLADGVTECIKAVREMVRRGASVIKIASSGGVASDDDPMTQQFSRDELVAVVQEAARLGLIVAAHCHGKSGVRAAVEAGCRTIEHGSCFADVGFTQTEMQDLREKGIVFVATRSVLEFAKAYPADWSEAAKAKLHMLDKSSMRSYKMAIANGLTIALGTDIATSSPTIPFQHGMNGKEFVYAVEAGLSPLKAIEAGTANGPSTLGQYKGPKSGLLMEGFDADMIILQDNPLDDIEVLASPEKITHVIKGGAVVKAPGKPVGLAL